MFTKPLYITEGLTHSDKFKSMQINLGADTLIF